MLWRNSPYGRLNFLMLSAGTDAEIFSLGCRAIARIDFLRAWKEKGRWKTHQLADPDSAAQLWLAEAQSSHTLNSSSVFNIYPVAQAILFTFRVERSNVAVDWREEIEGTLEGASSATVAPRSPSPSSSTRQGSKP
ncbi:hypothetical protein CRG98_010051 [Punica granatum]|uniref:Uncharacterized protein n=1 Tax=Punica granatum TaxID=22663 RepID=A0A2I0KM65_PUNGR|nr:hypothetical protein CRG98_010051 [Punica granatum]